MRLRLLRYLVYPQELIYLTRGVSLKLAVEPLPPARGSARRAGGSFLYWCPGPGATGAVGLLGGGDPILIVDGPATVRLPQLWLGHVYPAYPVRLAYIHLSPFHCLLAKSTLSVHQRRARRSPQRRRRAGRKTHGVGCDPGCGCYGSSRLPPSSVLRVACDLDRPIGAKRQRPCWGRNGSRRR